MQTELTIDQAAERLGVKRAVVARYCLDGRVPAELRKVTRDTAITRTAWVVDGDALADAYAKIKQADKERRKLPRPRGKK